MDSVADESWSTWNCRLPDLWEAICPQDDPRLLWLQHDTVCHEGWYWLGVKFVVTTKTSDLFLSDIIGNVLNSCTCVCVIVEVNCLVKLVLVNIEKKYGWVTSLFRIFIDDTIICFSCLLVGWDPGFAGARLQWAEYRPWPLRQPWLPRLASQHRKQPVCLLVCTCN